MARDWGEWHRAYDDPDSSLSRRLAIVQRFVGQALSDAPPGPVRVLSLCAGDARDITGGAAEHPRSTEVHGVLVELDPELAARAAHHVRLAGLDLDVRCADASDPAGFQDVLPVDVLLLVGIFGNITDEDVAQLVTAAPLLCRPGGSVIWTRHRREPDLTPSIRRWFDEAGCVAAGFEAPEGTRFAVGLERVRGGSRSGSLPSPLFRFVDDRW